MSESSKGMISSPQLPIFLYFAAVKLNQVVSLTQKLLARTQSTSAQPWETQLTGWAPAVPTHGLSVRCALRV